MKALLSIAIVIISSGSTLAQFEYTPRTYYARCNKELDAFRVKALTCFQTTLTSGNPDEIEVRRRQVVECIEQSQKEFVGMGGYQGDSGLQQVFQAGFDSLQLLFHNHYARVLHLRRYRKESFARLADYYQAMNQLEHAVVEIEKDLMKAEVRFAVRNGFKIEWEARHEHILRYGEVSRHLREQMLHFHKLDFLISGYMARITENPNVNLATFKLEEDLNNLHNELDQSLAKLALAEMDYMDPELHQALVAFLRDIKTSIIPDLLPIAHSLSAHSAYSAEVRNARIDLEFVVEDYALIRKRFTGTKFRWLERALESSQI